MQLLFLAISFLTTLPVPQVPFIEGGLGKSARFFPLVGFLIGGILWGGSELLVNWVSPLVAATIIVALWAGVTGGLHLDGFADCCDGLLVSADLTRRLEIMHDPRNGTFGTVGLIILLLLKTALLAEIIPNFDMRPLILLPPIFARWLILPVAVQPQARASGMGAAFARGIDRTTLIVAIMLPLGLAIFFGWQGVAAFVVTHLVAAGAVSLARQRIGGVTGDVLGLVVESAEVVTLLILTIVI